MQLEVVSVQSLQIIASWWFELQDSTYLRNYEESSNDVNVKKFYIFKIYNLYSKIFAQISLQKRENWFWSFFRCLALPKYSRDSVLKHYD
jgi:hypothetical protein